ncbi:MAG: hypothetical protein B7L53_00785 [Thermofilum sp. NZ13]|nr:MAG: hypothetical protein B7L53_00785 [Thermofilum sp. NZ13]
MRVRQECSPARWLQQSWELQGSFATGSLGMTFVKVDGRRNTYIFYFLLSSALGVPAYGLALSLTPRGHHRACLHSLIRGALEVLGRRGTAKNLLVREARSSVWGSPLKTLKG